MVESPGRCSHRCGRFTLQVLIRGTPFDHRCGRVAWQGLKKGGGFSRTALGHRPKNRAKGAAPSTVQRAPTPEPSFKQKANGPSLLCALPGFRPLLSGRSGLSCRLLFWGFAPSLFVVVRFGGVLVRVLLFAPCAPVWPVSLSFSCFQRRATTQGPIFLLGIPFHLAYLRALSCSRDIRWLWDIFS